MKFVQWALIRYTLYAYVGTSDCVVLSFPLLSLSPDMRRDVQEVFKNTPHEKQVMMFSATLPKEIRPVCKKFMNNVIHSLLASSLVAA